MKPAELAQYALFLAVVVALVRPLGGYFARVFERERTLLDPALLPLERCIHRALGVDPQAEMGWKLYAGCFCLFSAVGTAFLFALLLVQAKLPGGPDPSLLTTRMTPDLAANTAVSFGTTTTWQAYGGETTLKYAAQMVGLAAQNFLAGAGGFAVGIAFLRGFARERCETLGNFWVDVVRATLWVLLPFSLLGVVVLVWQGVPMSLHPYAQITTLEGKTQLLAQGPVAALEVVKNLGTNGGGFFNANAAHPYANPTPLTNLVAALMIAVPPAALTWTFGKWMGEPRLGWVLFGAMTLLFVGGLAVCHYGEAAGDAAFARAGVVGPNLEGKELRFGVGGSVLTAVVTSNGATGSNAAMHGSFTPIGVLVLISNMLLGEIVYGGLGTGLCGMVMTALLGLSFTGPMIGRTPEYAGKRIGPSEMKTVAFYALVTPMLAFPLTALAAATTVGRAGLTTNDGPRAFSELAFAYASCVANNGQAMAGLDANTPFYNLTTIVAMLGGRFLPLIAALALAGRFARQKRRPASNATLPVDGLTFLGVVVATALIVGGLSFLPTLAFGPLAEQLQGSAGR